MKYLKLTKTIAVIAVGSLIFSACKKTETAVPMGDAGQTLVKVLGGGTPASIAPRPIDFVATPTRILAVELRRDVPSETELNKTMVVTIKDDTAAVRAAGRLQFPTAWYTLDIDGTKTGGQGGVFTFTFKPGEFAKNIFVVVPNATLLDPSAVYGLGFTILTADAGGKISTQKSVVVEIGAKNIYDGIYSYVSGLVTRYTAPGVPAGDLLSGPLGPLNNDIIMATIGANTVSIPPSGSAGALTWSYLTMPLNGVAGIDGIQLTVNPSTNQTTVLCTGYGANSNPTFANWAPPKPNNYNPGTKTFTTSWRWNPTSNTREYEMVLKYKGPR